MSDNKIEFDGKNQRIILHGSCDELRPLCEAACCRHRWIVGISPEEHNSGLYSSQASCILTGKECSNYNGTCQYRYFELKKTPNGACVHLDDANRCSIYENRPQVCRDNSCHNGWQLAAFSPPEDMKQKRATAVDKETFIQSLNENMIFVLHPLMKVHAIVILSDSREVVFVNEIVGNCGKFHSRDTYFYPQLNEDLFLNFIRCFERKESLQNLYHFFCGKYSVSISKDDFYSIIWLLCKHNIILDTKKLRGMLSGIG